MPTYAYACGRCGPRFDLFQRISDPPEGTCPKCNHAHAERLISAPGFILRGSGFYVNDYGRNGSSKKSNGADPNSNSKQPA